MPSDPMHDAALIEMAERSYALAKILNVFIDNDVEVITYDTFMKSLYRLKNDIEQRIQNAK